MVRLSLTRVLAMKVVSPSNKKRPRVMETRISTRETPRWRINMAHTPQK